MTEKVDGARQASRSQKRQCHICGSPNVEGWCVTCCKRFCGKSRKPPAEMSAGEKAAEIRLLLSPPYEIPLALMFNRFRELSGPGRNFGSEEFFEWEYQNDRERPNPVIHRKKPVPEPLPPSPEAPATPVHEFSGPAVTSPARPSRMQSFAQGIDPGARTAMMPAAGSQPHPIVSRERPPEDDAVPGEIIIEAYPGTQAYHSGSMPPAPARVVPPPLPAAALAVPPAVSLRPKKP